MTKAIIKTLIITALITAAVSGSMVWLIMDRQMADTYGRGRAAGILWTLEEMGNL